MVQNLVPLSTKIFVVYDFVHCSVNYMKKSRVLILCSEPKRIAQYLVPFFRFVLFLCEFSQSYSVYHLWNDIAYDPRFNFQHLFNLAYNIKYAFVLFVAVEFEMPISLSCNFFLPWTNADTKTQKFSFLCLFCTSSNFLCPFETYFQNIFYYFF